MDYDWLKTAVECVRQFDHAELTYSDVAEEPYWRELCIKVLHGHHWDTPLVVDVRSRDGLEAALTAEAEKWVAEYLGQCPPAPEGILHGTH
jgi:hypothetical protein